jgi:hypothetical protein
MNEQKPEQTIESSSITLTAPAAPLQPSTGGDLIAFARSQEELHQSQEQLIAWSANKLKEARQHLGHMGANLEQAKQYSWALAGFRSAVIVARKQCDFYEKLHAAFSAGYCVVPDFPIDVFAVRTKRGAPEHQSHDSNYEWGDSVDRHQHGAALPIGKGDYVSDEPVVLRKTLQGKDKAGEPVTVYRRWAQEFKDVDFPIKTAAITVLDATGRAMAAKIFDEIGILPERKKPKTDPMVIGRIQFKHGSRERTVSFVIAWFLRESDLMV